MQRISSFGKRSSMLALVLILVLASFTVATERSEAVTAFKKVVSPTSTGGGLFGEAVAVVGNKFLVGARGECATICGGAVHLFDSNGNPIRTIPTPTLFSSFGASVGGVRGNPLVGAIHDDTAGELAGAAYLFDAATGRRLQTFLNPNPAPGGFSSIDFFGEAVAGFGNDALVAAPSEDLGAADAGVVYLFDGATGQLIRTIQNPTPAASERFGAQITSVGNNIAVTAIFDGTAAPNAGAVYLFDASGNLIRTIVSPKPVGFGSFGISLAAVGNNLLVGEERGFTGDIRAGAVHLFDGTTGEFIRSFFNPTPEAFELFGNAVAAKGNDVLIGATRDNTAGPHAGAAYLLDGATGGLIHTFLNPEPTAPSFSEDRFAWQVAAIGQSILVSAPDEDSNPRDNKAADGIAYLFRTE